MDWLFLRTDFYCEKGSNDFVGFELDVIRHRPFLLIVPDCYVMTKGSTSHDE